MPPQKHARSPSADAIYDAPAGKIGKHNTSNDPLRHPTIQVAKRIDADTPFNQLTTLLKKSSSDDKPRNVLHWFRSKDLRHQDNRALAAAAEKVKEGNGNLITCYLHSPKDMEWHGTSPARVDLILETLKLLQKELEDKNVPLAILVAEERKDKTSRVLEFVKKWDISHVYANMEYEVDELRRDIDFIKKKGDGVGFEVLHDQTVVEPLALCTGAGTPHKVFTPYHRAWLGEVGEDPGLLDTVASPEGNEKTAREEFKELFGGKIPKAPENKQFADDKERERVRKLWPAGHDAGMKKLSLFLDQKVDKYAGDRSTPALDPSSRLSPYFASGLISIREVMKACLKHKTAGGKKVPSLPQGPAAWVRELVFREFYRHTTCATPHTSMNLPVNLKFDNVEWESDEEGWKKWCEGTTGVPFVDAGMRQLRAEKWMHNRARMNTSSYLSANLLIDYRRGERYFAEHLVDWDLSNNTNGWQPSYTVFNPVSQAEKCDPDGEYIRRWVPELKHVKGKAVFAPSERLGKGEFEKLGYPRPHVEYGESKARAVERYKKGIAEARV
ncbi:unnamed protein product [Zymoseptoria tritici ST99CH_1E4]|uniref:Photolyase/cryptochrome alpha/beta domain-containing protein n=1 Tax=Zymoseptoria tritici ST99CH_1E4 TaxID=1276532 RepID=A0A2H1H868_ZYMTR|nr:unnamed protein product [Zymoseptoria tritici ST99CH_1E4]